MKTSDLKIRPWRIAAFSMVALSFACCTVVPDYVAEVECDGVDEIAATEGSIPVEEALGALNRTLAVIDGATRNRTRVAQHVSALTKREMFGNSSRASSVRGGDDDNLVYVVNFAGDQGFAIINACNFLRDTVLIVGDSGYLDPERLLSGISRSGDDGDLYEPTPDSLKIMFADLYCEEDDDFYIGNSGDFNGDGFPPAIIKGYFVGDGLHDDTVGGGSGPEADENGFNKATLVPRLLKTTWNQRAPFNNEIKFVSDGSKRRPVGCTTIAAAQILACRKNVDLANTFGITTSSWEELESVVPDALLKKSRNDNETIHANNIAKMLKQMADGIKVKYESDGTSATTRRVRKYLESIGCNVTQYYSLSNSVESKIQNSISSGKPVYIGALDHHWLKNSGHAWVFDGYGKRPSDDHCFLHCNFGWAGTSNGWYYYKLFKKSSDKKILDDVVGENDNKFNYSWAYRVLIIK